jgi:hypothetical protein
MTVAKTPRPPADLGATGRRLWADTVEAFVLTPAELRLLHEAGRTADELDRLGEALAAEPMTVPGSKGQLVPHPLLAQLRAHRATLARLFNEMALPSEGQRVGAGAASERGRKAASARWQVHLEKKERREVVRRGRPA